MKLLTKKTFLVLMLLGFVCQGLWAAQSQAATAACCDPSMKAAMQMSHDGIGSTDSMTDMPCHDQEQSCEGCCQNVLPQSSALTPAGSTLAPVNIASRKPVSPNQVLAGISLNSIPHPPNA